MHRTALLCLALTGLLPALAHGQVGRDIAERGSNRAQISQGKKALERDTKELEGFSSAVAGLEKAVGAGDATSANSTFAKLAPQLTTEVQQGAAKAEAAKKELAGSVSETGSNRRESRRNRDDSDAFGRTSDDEADAVRDGLNRVDDARDVADDKRDLEAIGQRVQRQQQIGQALAGYQFSFDSDASRKQASQQIGLLKEFESLMQADLAATEQEIAEDKREAGEDRRETRDDLREADEIDNRARRETGNYGRRRR